MMDWLVGKAIAVRGSCMASQGSSTADLPPSIDGNVEALALDMNTDVAAWLVMKMAIVGRHWWLSKEIVIHLKMFHRLKVRYLRLNLPRKQMDSAHEFFSVPPRNVKSHRRFSVALKSSKLLFFSYNAIVQSHESLSQTDYCRSSALWFDHSAEEETKWKHESRFNLNRFFTPRESWEFDDCVTSKIGGIYDRGLSVIIFDLFQRFRLNYSRPIEDHFQKKGELWKVFWNKFVVTW